MTGGQLNVGRWSQRLQAGQLTARRRIQNGHAALGKLLSEQLSNQVAVSTDGCRRALDRELANEAPGIIRILVVSELVAILERKATGRCERLSGLV